MKNVNWKSAIVVIFIIVLVAVYFRYFHLSSGNTNENTSFEQNGSNDSLGTGSASIGSEAPLFILSDSFGKSYKLEGFVGKKPILIVFETTWCSWCKKELADLEKFYNTYQNDILLLTIDIGESKEEVKSWVEKNNIQRPWLIDKNEKVTTAYLANGTPSHVLIDKKGIVINRGPRYESMEK